MEVQELKRTVGGVVVTLLHRCPEEILERAEIPATDEKPTSVADMRFWIRPYAGPIPLYHGKPV